MKFRALKLAGFKSFVDPTEVRLEAGLTGVVGPNGCGKSNLFEAVRWVMGANSAKALRGAEMEDVIFAGTDRRPARNHAEVMLVMEAGDGEAPAGFGGQRELEVSRRIGRGAGSTYRVNGKEVRAKDVQLLFADASTGANSPALVRQGQISELVNAKPENRRRVLEEAAGIAGLRQRRHEAELKLRAAETNLERAEEELVRLEAEAGRLKRQSRQAQRYKRLAAEIRRAEALIQHLRWVAASEALAAAETGLHETAVRTASAGAEAARTRTEAAAAQVALPGVREAEARAAAALRAAETEHDALAREIATAEAEAARMQARLAELETARAREQEIATDADSALARLAEETAALEQAASGESGLLATAETDAEEAARERGRAETELERLSSEAAQIRAQIEAAARRRADLGARRERLAGQIAAVETEIAGFDSGLPARTQALREACAEADQAAEYARAGLHDTEAARTAAEQAAREADEAARAARARARELEAEQGGLERALAAGKTRDWTPALDAVRPQPGYERALAAALGDDLEAALGGDAPLRWDGAETPEQALPDGVLSLARFVEAPPALAARLSQIGVAEAEAAPALARLLKPGQRLATREGHLWRWDGFVAGEDALSSAAARMEQRARLEAIATELAAASEETARLTEAFEGAEQSRRAAAETFTAARATLATAEQEARDARRALEQAMDAAAEAERARAAAEARLAGMTAELAETEQAQAEAAEAERGIGEGPSEDEIDMARDRVAEARDAAAHARDTLVALRAEQTRRAARMAEIERESGNWRERGERAAQALEVLHGEAERAGSALDEASAKPGALAESRAALEQQCEAAQEAAHAARDALAEAERRAEAAETEARRAEAEHATLRETAAAAEQKRTDAAERLEERRAEILRAAECAPEALAERAGELMESGLDLDAAEAALETSRRQRESIGEVNLRADAELEEIETAHAKLAAERDDLAQAVTELRRGVERLNVEARQRLLSSFDVINGHFQSLFATLFEGGEARLALTESNDPLEAGLEIYACPPGKRMASLSLMSGGEQALTACALIFAVFLSNPAPLCVLDEVDAPLDDANVDRFCNLLDEMRKRTDTHFMIITHNAVTMSRMDRLYGVTMAEQGASQLVSVDLEAAEQLAAAE